MKETKAKDLVHSIKENIKYLKETAPKMEGEVKDYEENTHFWDVSDRVITIDTTSTVIQLTKEQLQQMLSALEYLEQYGEDVDFVLNLLTSDEDSEKDSE